MAMKKVSFEFPADAWDGIVNSLTENSYQAFVRNPDYNGSDNSIPQQIANPMTREEAALDRVKSFVAEQYKSWAQRASLAPIQKQVQTQVDARAVEVNAATKVSVEEVA